jgi:hypothetical protein
MAATTAQEQCEQRASDSNASGIDATDPHTFTLSVVEAKPPRPSAIPGPAVSQSRICAALSGCFLRDAIPLLTSGQHCL